MKVKELIEKLKQFDQELKVKCFSLDYGCRYSARFFEIREGFKTKEGIVVVMPDFEEDRLDL